MLPVVAGAGVAGANPALCGMVVTQSTTLTSDVGPCTSTGIVVGASGVTLDLGGHRVFASPDAGDEGPGILVQGRTGVTIRNGTVQHFDAGIAIIGGSSNIIDGITAKDNIGNAFTDFGDGIFVLNSSNNRILNSVADHNGPYDGIGLLGNSDGNLIENNRIINNTIINSRSHGGSEGTMEDDGIRLESTSRTVTPDRNVVRGNQILNNGLDGIAVFPNATDNQIMGNTINNNGYLGNVRRGDGVHIFAGAARTGVLGNTVRFNARHGIRIDPTPVFPPPNLQNRIQGNIATDNGVDPGEFDSGYDLSDGNRFCDGNVWQGNQHVTWDPVTGVDCYN
ncbi:MAG: right-handed parallel beta-helix repeat-containing protein [Acidimicrobiia bacterium]